jgi:hypothetical protein
VSTRAASLDGNAEIAIRIDNLPMQAVTNTARARPASGDDALKGSDDSLDPASAVPAGSSGSFFLPVSFLLSKAPGIVQVSPRRCWSNIVELNQFGGVERCSVVTFAFNRKERISHSKSHPVPHLESCLSIFEI